ncbi:MAG: anti-sigma factor family protein [Myxococcaceae bacterium]
MAKDSACQSFIPLLSAFIDGELPPADRQAVEQHIHNCKDCAGRVADLRAESGLVRVGLEMAADEVDWSNFSQKVMAQLTPQKLPVMERLKLSLSEMFQYQRGTLISGFAVAAALLLVVGTVVMRPEQSSAGYAADQFAVQSVKTDQSAHVQPVVMDQDQGSAIIWLVDHPAQNDPDRSMDSRNDEAPMDVGAVPVKGSADGGTSNDTGGAL